MASYLDECISQTMCIMANRQAIEGGELFTLDRGYFQRKRIKTLERIRQAVPVRELLLL